MKEKLDNIRQKISTEGSGYKATTAEQNTHIRAIAILITLVGFLLPWITLDGYAGSFSGSELIAYAFISPERASLFSVSKMGTLTLLAVPITTLSITIYGLYQSMKGEPSLGAHLAAVLAPISMLILTGGIVSTEWPRMFGMPLPGIGIIVIIITQGGLFTERLTEGDV